MKSAYRITNRAAEDLEEIWAFIAQDDPLAADKFIAQLLETAVLLASSPLIGRQRDDLLKGVRAHPHGNYLIFYRVSGSMIELMRVLHGGRDLPTVFGNN